MFIPDPTFFHPGSTTPSVIHYYRSGCSVRKFDASDRVHCAGLCSRLTGNSLKTEQKIVLAVNTFSTPLGIPNKEKERELLAD
jgi:hypothetical protein